MNKNEVINLKEFEEKTLNLDDIFLDPNNPRFYGREKLISDTRIISDSIQKGCLEKMEIFSTDELKENIQRVGFLPIDKIVVRPIKNVENKYVVVEGNRRITALKQLKMEHERGEIELPEGILDSILKFKVYVYTGKEPDIAWVIQGIRHISGIKNWKPYQQAKLLTLLVKERNIKIEDAGKAVGIGPTKSARLMRSYYAYEQSTEDEEFGDQLSEDYFSFFQEAVFPSIGTPMQNWLEWDEKEKRFKNVQNLKKYLSWMFGIDGKLPRVNRALEVRDVIAKAIVHYPTLFRKFESSDDMSVSRLEHEIWSLEEEPKELAAWFETLKNLKARVEDLPDAKIKTSQDHKKFTSMLEELKKIIEAHLSMLENP